MAGKTRVHKNDTVLVITGKYQGRRARVLDVRAAKGLVLVEGVAMVKKHLRRNASKNIAGGIDTRERYISVSNVKIVCPACKEPTRAGALILGDGKKVRACRNCQATLDREA